MTIGDLDKANNLINELTEQIIKQNEIIQSINRSIKDYIDYLQSEIRRVR